MSIISKELLSEVLGVYVRNGWYFDCELLIYTYDKILGLDENYHSQINIYELAHKCKEWASSYGYDLFSHRFDANASYAYLDLGMKNVIPSNNKYIFIGSYIQEFESNTEPEAIFKACQWILKEHSCNQLT